jgi:hypothetical protein
MTDDPELPLFTGPHVPRIRFERAIERLDFRAAARDAPEEWRSAVEEFAAAADREGAGKTPELELLLGLRRDGWPVVLERAWQRVAGRCLDRRGIPGVLGGEPAAAYLLRGGERERARKSIHRHLEYHPRDPRAWAVLAEFEPLRGAARCGFHGGPLLDGAGDLIDMVREDELEPVARWLLPYAWFSGGVTLDEIARALAAEGAFERPPLPIPADARVFAWYLLDAGGRPLGSNSVGVVEARKRLQRISRAAFRRYLLRVAG